MRTIQCLDRTLDAKDSCTEGHSERVSSYAAQIAEGLRMSEEEIENVRTVTLLHDIGKIGVPDSALNKPGHLTDDEFDHVFIEIEKGAGSQFDHDIARTLLETLHASKFRSMRPDVANKANAS